MKYPLELKKKVLKDYFDGVDGIRGLERTYGIQHQLILSWIKKCKNPGKRIRQGEEARKARLHLHKPHVFEDPRKELEYLRTENAYLREMLILNGYRKNGRKKKDLLPSNKLPYEATK